MLWDTYYITDREGHHYRFRYWPLGVPGYRRFAHSWFEKVPTPRTLLLETADQGAVTKLGPFGTEKALTFTNGHQRVTST